MIRYQLHMLIKFSCEQNEKEPALKIDFAVVVRIHVLIDGFNILITERVSHALEGRS